MSNIANYISSIIFKAGEGFSAIWLYVILGVISGEVLKFTSWTRIIYNCISKSKFIGIIIAAILGIVSPLCTFGTVPVVLQLFKAGVPLAPLIVFLSTSSLMNPQLFFYTLGGLGLEMAVVRVIAVFVFGLILGILLYKAPLTILINPNILPRGNGADEALQQAIIKEFSWRTFLNNTWHSLEYIGYYLLIGVFLGAVVEVITPDKWIAFIFNSGGWLVVIGASLVSIPFYSCGGGIIPLIRSFMQMGMSKGAALAFFLVGPATRITPLMALAAVLRPGFVVLYVLLMLAFSMISGLIYQ